MTNNAPARRAASSPAPQAGAMTAPSVAIGKHLTPLRDLREFERLACGMRTFAGRVEDWPGGDVPDLALEQLRAERDALPPASKRSALRRVLADAGNAAPTHGDLARLVGGLFDGFARFDASRTPGAADAWLMCVEIDLAEAPASPLALALAAVGVLRTERWAPPAEFMDRVRAAERRICRAVGLLDAVDHALARLAELEASNTPAARAARAAEEAAASRRRAAFAEKMKGDIRSWAQDDGPSAA